MGGDAVIRETMDPRPFPPKQFGDRRQDYAPSACRCEIPVPIQTTDYGNGEPAQYACTECGHALNGDSTDAPFRRWPGDLVSGAVAEARYRRDEVVLLRRFVTELPAFEQRRLARLPKARFVVEARAACRRFVEAQRKRADEPTATPTPPAEVPAWP